jgi:polar amino acid transport system substrate-binding protein
MKKMSVLLLSAALACTGAFANEVINLAIGEWAPFTSEKDPNGKLLEKVVTEAFKLEGVDVKYSYYPWKRSYSNVQEGTSDGTFPWRSTADREKEFNIHSVPVMTDDSVYFMLKTSAFDWKTMDDLKKYKVGVTLGYTNEKTYKDKGIAAEVVPSEELNFKKIVAGRIDVYETSKEVGYATIAKSLTPDEAKLMTHHAKPVEESDYFILFSKKTPKGKAMADKFDAGLKKLKASGAYTKIFAK